MCHFLKQSALTRMCELGLTLQGRKFRNCLSELLKARRV